MFILGGNACNGKFVNDLILFNWLRVLVKAFSDQDEREIREKCMARLELSLSKFKNIEEAFKRQLADDPEIFYRETSNDNIYIDVRTNSHIGSRTTAIESSFIAEFIESLGIDESVPLGKKTLKIKISTVDLSDLLIVYDETILLKHPSMIVPELLMTKKLVEGWSEATVQDILRLIVNDVECVSKELIEIIYTLCQRTFDANAINIKDLLNKISIREGMDLELVIVALDLIGLFNGGHPLSLGEFYEQCIELCFRERDSKTAGIVLEKIIGLHGWDVELIATLQAQLKDKEGAMDKRSMSSLHGVLCKALSQTKLETLSGITAAIKVFAKLTQEARTHIDNGHEEGSLRHGRVFIEKLTKEGLAQLQYEFIPNRQIIIETLKILQGATRSIQIIINHLKPSKKATLKSLLPPMRRALETLLFGVKGMLEANNCLSAFWVGNLKHRAIDGSEIGPEMTIEAAGNDSDVHESNDAAGDDQGDTDRFPLSKELISDSDTED